MTTTTTNTDRLIAALEQLRGMEGLSADDADLLLQVEQSLEREGRVSYERITKLALSVLRILDVFGVERAAVPAPSRSGAPARDPSPRLPAKRPEAERAASAEPSTDDLATHAAAATRQAFEETLARGLPAVIVEGGQIVEVQPDGSRRVLGEAPASVRIPDPTAP